MSNHKINRREFIGRSAAMGAALIGGRAVGGWALTGEPAAKQAGLAVVSGADAAAMTVRAVKMLGGIGAFVPKGSKVALLPNVQSKHPGTYTKPEILRAVIRLCRDAGASEIACLSLLTQAHWD
ncbi:MAG: twin-arginine translocation signal domain-containing protein, partial [Acidobacteriota bacterium]|nr:twin-arginine translocation signal domain-containing protein [Acidobacteriota bacterium]